MVVTGLHCHGDPGAPVLVSTSRRSVHEALATTVERAAHIRTHAATAAERLAVIIVVVLDVNIEKSLA